MLFLLSNDNRKKDQVGNKANKEVGDVASDDHQYTRDQKSNYPARGGGGGRPGLQAIQKPAKEKKNTCIHVYRLESDK